MRSIVAAGIVVSVVGVPSFAFAQAQEAGQRQVDEILVVAQKKGRAENLQEVPAAITAYNADQLDGIQFQKLDDLSYSIPNVQLEQVGTFPGVQNFSIRGQGINSSIPSVDPTVGVFVDGIYQGTTYGTVLDTWDLESIEVLRGPQGLLFGRNVTGGAVTVRTARPDPSGEFAVKAKAEITDSDRYGAAVAFEGPIIQDVLAGKIMLYYDDDDGYFENKNPAPWASGPVNTAVLGGVIPPPYTPTQFTNFDPVNQALASQGAPSQRNAGRLETTVIRPSFVWNATESLEVALITEFGEVEGDGAVWTVVDDNVAPPPAAIPGTLWLSNNDNGSAFPAIGSVADGGVQPFTTTSDEYGFTEIDWSSVTLEINWDIAGGTLTNIFGWKDVEQSSATDVDGSYLPAFVATGGTDQDQLSNELRFATTIGDSWDMTIGVYYLQQDIDYREGRYIQVIPPSIPPPPLAVGTPVPNLRLVALGGTMETETYGIFWNNDFAVTDTVTLTAGIRYSKEDKDAQIIDGALPPLDAVLAFCPDVQTYNCSRSDLSGDWDSWTPKLGVQWQFAESAQAYALWTQGYRTGGFNFRNAKPGPLPPLGYPAGPTEQEEQNSYEIGLKSEVFDNRLRMNLAYFYNEIDDIQRELNQGDPDVVVLQATVNAGDVTIKGVEFEFTAVPTDQMTIYGSLGYLDGEYDRVNPLYSGINPFTGAPYIGSDLPRLAPWSFSLGGSYDFFLGGGNGIIRLQADYGYRDENYYDDANTQLFDSQHRLSGSVSWLSDDDRWTVTLFGKNLRDEANYGNLTSIAGLWTAGPMQKGREYGLQLQYRL